MSKLTNCLINFSILVALIACYQDPNILQSPSPAHIETSPEACICLEDLHPISPQQLWQQFFQQRGAGIVWQELQKSTPEIHINLYELEQPLINNAVLQIVKGSIRYLNYHHAAVVRLKFTGEIDNQNKQLNILPTEIGDLVGLQELSLQENALSELPADIGKLSQLLKLDLAYNQLNELPLEIGDLVHLTELDLTGNYISELPSETSQLVNLTSLNMASNSLLQFPSVIGNLIKLKQLNLSGNHLYKLPAAFKKLTNLQLLDLSTNLLTKLPSSIGELPYLNNILLSQNEFIALPASIHTKLNQSELRNNPWIASQNLIEISPTDLATQCYQKLPPSLLDICGRYILCLVLKKVDSLLNQSWYKFTFKS